MCVCVSGGGALGYTSLSLRTGHLKWDLSDEVSAFQGPGGGRSMHREQQVQRPWGRKELGVFVKSKDNLWFSSTSAVLAGHRSWTKCCLPRWLAEDGSSSPCSAPDHFQFPQLLLPAASPHVSLHCSVSSPHHGWVQEAKDLLLNTSCYLILRSENIPQTDGCLCGMPWGTWHLAPLLPILDRMGKAKLVLTNTSFIPK